MHRHPSFSDCSIGYLTSAAFQSKEKFHSEVQSTPDLPAIIAKGLTTDMLGSLISWKSQLYNEYDSFNLPPKALIRCSKI